MIKTRAELNDTAQEDNYDLVGTQPFKLKDRPESRRMQMINLELFGKIPKRIIIEKVLGEHDTFVLRAFLPKAVKDNVVKA